MSLDVREAARLLRVPVQRIYRWIHREDLPAHGHGDLLQFNRTELEEWSRRHAPEPLLPVDELPSLRAALRHGGIHRDIEASDRDSALRALAQLPGDRIHMTPDALYDELRSREDIAPTTVGGGFAIPHPREAGLTGVEIECVQACCFASPVDFGALDGGPIHTALLLLAPSGESRLQLVALVGFALRDPDLCRLMRERASDEAILARADALLEPVETRRR